MNSASRPEELELEGPEQRELPNLQDYLRILFRYKWGILALVLVSGVISALRAMSEVPLYDATSTLLIERQAARFVSIEEVYRGSQGWDFGEYYQTQYEILRSRPIAERVVDKLGLEAFAKSTSNIKPAFSWRNLLGRDQAPAVEAAKPDPKTAREAAVNQVLGSLDVAPVRNSQLVRIRMRGPNPEFAAVLANTHSQAYIEEMLEGRLQMTQTASQWLNERTKGLREKLEASEKALQEFRDRERLLDVKGVDSLASTEVGLASERLAEARRERIDKETIYNQVKSARSLEEVPALLVSPIVQQYKTTLTQAEAEVRELSQRYGARHPKMSEANTKLEGARAALNRQLRIAANAVESEYRAAVSRENALSGELGAAKGELLDLNRKQYELTALEREVESNRQIYELFQNRFKETSASGGVQTANARLVEMAQVPRAQVWPNKRRATMIGLLIGLALGIALALILDHMDNTLKGAEDVEKRLGLAVIGLVPKLKSLDEGGELPINYFGAHPQSSFSEAIRTIRTGVLLSAVDETHKRILITSSVPSEGKTTLSMNLATALGHMKKVLLIDADMRRPSIHKGLPDQRQSPGLSEYITGERKISECMRQIEGSNLFVMPAGIAPPNPLEILSSRKFAESLEALSRAFDHVIIDCAPACAVSDALVLSKLVHGVVYVVRSDSTQWQIAKSGVKRLRRIDAPLIGAVVNQVVPRRTGYAYGKYYYHGDGYYSDYGYAKSKSRSKTKRT